MYGPTIHRHQSHIRYKKDTLFVTFADRGRFPLLMDSYSYKLQSAIPNPDLEPEHSRNWDIGYSHGFGLKTVAQIEYFNENLRNEIESVTIVDPAPCARATLWPDIVQRM